MPETDFIKKYNASPPEIKDLINSEKLINLLQSTAVLTNLTPEQTERLTDIISNILVRKTPVNKLPYLVASSLRVSPVQVKIITQIANQKIFDPVKQYLLVDNTVAQPKINTPSPKVTTSKENFISQKLTATSPVKKPASNPEVPQQVISEQAPAPRNLSPKQTPTPTPTPTSTTPTAPPTTTSTTPLATKEQLSKETIIPKTKLSNLSSIPLSSSIPEPSETIVGKPELKTTELKNFSVSPEYQKKNEQIKNKLLEAMKKRSAPPSIVKAMEEVSQEMSNFKNTRKTREKVKHSLPKPASNSIAPSQVVLGQGNQKFISPKKDKNKANTPFILDVKLQENENKPKKNTPFQKRKHIKYSKFKPQNPFGNA